ncbi:MAG: hypothetical protein A2729_05245 [Candidatus Buchananbacteria bacterium RIFCSPHIGHO2_01_FULL_39_14]|uniref:Radical SAM core domain-containing protein n=1 Tax=Candidatus Buchananbacteria bacterium RIFCSPHIGHO2_01_FULL_39_14 TaxID=1797532 RepID=A0A1G1XUV7_9BACT|nr:MAG: hypothetical protein A2729_05245 [Candidatus Buchananbacteria bacterium RIFCSPHIGHO2_01_FULL_39_14]
MIIKAIDWKLIGTCNLRCLHCYGPPKTERALPTENLRVLIEIFKELECKLIVLTGGEPLLVKDIDEIMRLLKAKGITVALSTNTSYFFEHGEAINECVSSLNIPLDGSTVEIHSHSRLDEKSFHSFWEVLQYYKNNPDKKPRMLRVGTVYSAANHGDFVAIAKLLQPFDDLIDTWKIYELIDYEFQPDLRKSIIHRREDFEKEMSNLLINTSLAPKIFLASAQARDKAYFMVNPKGQVVIPTDQNGMTFEVVIGDLLNMPAQLVAERWSQTINMEHYCLNHDTHYKKF